MRPVFDSRNEDYRSPFGAQPAGQAVFLKICLPRSLGCSAARLCVEKVIPQGEKSVGSYGMFWAGMQGSDHEWWDCRFTPQQPAVYFYRFELDTNKGRGRLFRLQDGKAGLAFNSDDPCSAWQLTCYAPDFTTPDWLAGGVMYQIFPDRFSASGTKKEGIPADRIIRDDWGGQPHWRPDNQGEIRNNDYFGGDLKGIEQRLDRLAALGVSCIYLNPIFEAHSNHRYDTADYSKIDPLLGSQEDFISLVRSAHQVGIRILLDGVFSHTGADSVYFNKENRYNSIGAANSEQSPYYGWYKFEKWPDSYSAWWGVPTLPEVNETDAGFLEYINSESGIVRQRIREGIGGWRLDVADELPDEFLDSLYAAAKQENPDGLILGEIWEDASNKESYGGMRRYLLGGQLDSVMNYPFRNAIIKYLKGGGGADFINSIMDIVENYPPQVTRLLMNHIGTHDTERAITVLAGDPAEGRGREWQAGQSMTPIQRERGLSLLRLAAVLQYTLPGVPCIYYGDEAGMEGYRDPFNRGCYPWGKEDENLMKWYRRLGQLRRSCRGLKDGQFSPIFASKEVVCFERYKESERLICAVNASREQINIKLPEVWRGGTTSLGGGHINGNTLFLPPFDCAVATLSDVV
ncbi:MAG: glycoside hydrolase family 13 protein [Oscillospiraceae bacterium]|nr:glycoside hydrolase family 13 protein [Oscillospiraceae bacterium]MDD3833608.1 glycoside hydrolase family 13 protein [Oscillospiraceae bacterium]